MSNLLKKVDGKLLSGGSDSGIALPRVNKLSVEEVESFNIFEKELRARKFVDCLVAAKGNLVAAIRKFVPGYVNGTSEACYKRGVKEMEKLGVRKLIDEELKAQSISISGIVNSISEIAKVGKRDADRLRALELLGKFKKMFGEEEKVKGNVYNLNISEDAAKRLLERRDRSNVITVSEESD